MLENKVLKNMLQKYFEIQKDVNTFVTQKGFPYNN